jgi:hypothetical protein
VKWAQPRLIAEQHVLLRPDTEEGQTLVRFDTCVYTPPACQP